MSNNGGETQPRDPGKGGRRGRYPPALSYSAFNRPLTITNVDAIELSDKTSSSSILEKNALTGLGGAFPLDCPLGSDIGSHRQEDWITSFPFLMRPRQ